jgi:hypothetical protein
MRLHEQNNESDRKTPTRRRNNSLFYFQQEGQCSYLRFTPLGATMLVLIIVIPVIALLIMFFINSRTPEPQVNTDIAVPATTPFSPNTPVIRQAPPPSPAKVVKQPDRPKPPTVSTPSNNLNEQLAPKQTPQPLPSEPPP